MPPRKRGRARGRPAGVSKAPKATEKRAIKADEEEEPPSKLVKEESLNTKLKRIVKEEKATGKKKFKPDSLLLDIYGDAKPEIYQDYSCMLNQTNIGKNSNKFYIIQIAKVPNNAYTIFTKWGRVGERGQYENAESNDVEEAVKKFKKKFNDKTRNIWDKRDDFKPVPGKYTLIDMCYEESDDEEDAVDGKGIVSKKVKSEVPPCTLDKRTQLLIQLILNDDMFKDQMISMQLDIKKMPLGKLSKSQILKGLEALLELEQAIKNNEKKNVLEQLSSKFYTVVPHNFGRMTPPVIMHLSVVDQKKDLMMTLTDIEIAQSLQKEETKDENLNPFDINYQKLNCKLERIDNDSEEFKIIQTYATSSKNTRKGALLDVWRVDRIGQAERFQSHSDIAYRKLLWHGTSVAVVAAILKAGLRIMPHSGGSVGKGIYFASEHAKSSWYVRPHNGKFSGELNVGFMFLVEVVLGKMNFIQNCDSSLTAAPKGFNSVVARGRNEPDPKKDIKRKYDNKDVIIPVGPPISQREFSKSCFSQSEYLIYKESQARIRYLLKFSFDI